MRTIVAPFFVLISIASLAQSSKDTVDWAPIGAEWTYNLLHPLLGPEEKAILTLESISDTLINEKNCRELRESYDRDLDGETDSVTTHYIHQSGDTIYYYNRYLDQFSILYNFASSDGDIIRITEPRDGFSNDSMLHMEVSQSGFADTISSGLRSYIMSRYIPPGTFASPWVFDGLAIEKLGNIDTYFFPVNDRDCDGACPFGLLCYQDQDLAITISESSYCITSTTHDFDDPGILVYPNPTHGALRIHGPSSWNHRNDFDIQIFDLAGQFLENLELQDATLDFSKFASGTYFVTFSVSGSYSTTHRIVKL